MEEAKRPKRKREAEVVKYVTPTGRRPPLKSGSEEQKKVSTASAPGPPPSFTPNLWPLRSFSLLLAAASGNKPTRSEALVLQAPAGGHRDEG
eukprot:COSAG06_NODE_903_length_11646_cov_15.420975_3_plen_92_part_00